ncbi:MAG: hypothetical protein FWD79_10630 [Desulfobulbus sp.]|nr:hypothetical protein [Desulfobulbus sp.]
MAQVSVVLTATFDDGKVQLKPGATASMEKNQAEQLAALGMARIVLKAAPAKAAREKPLKLEKTNSTPEPPPSDEQGGEEPGGDGEPAEEPTDENGDSHDGL